MNHDRAKTHRTSYFKSPSLPVFIRDLASKALDPHQASKLALTDRQNVLILSASFNRCSGDISDFYFELAPLMVDVWNLAGTLKRRFAAAAKLLQAALIFHQLTLAGLGLAMTAVARQDSAAWLCGATIDPARKPADSDGVPASSSTCPLCLAAAQLAGSDEAAAQPALSPRIFLVASATGAPRLTAPPALRAEREQGRPRAPPHASDSLAHAINI